MADIEISYDALTDKFTRKMKSLQREVKKTDSAATRAALAVGIIGATAGAAVSGMLALTSTVAELRAETVRLSEESGLAGETVEALRKRAQSMGREASSLDGAMEDLGERIRDAASGTGDAAAAFDELGVSAVDASGNLRQSDEVLVDLLGALEAVESQEQKAALATLALGDAGRALGTSVDLEGLERWTETIKLIGIDYGPEAVAQTKRFQTNVTLLKTAAEGAAGSLADAFDVSGSIEKATLGIVFMRFLMEELSTDASKTASELGAAYDEMNALGGTLDEGIAAKIPANLILLRGFVSAVEQSFASSSEAVEDTGEKVEGVETAYDRAMSRAREFYELQQELLADAGDATMGPDSVVPLSVQEEGPAPEDLKRQMQERIEGINEELEATRALKEARAEAAMEAIQMAEVLSDRDRQANMEALQAKQAAQELYYDSVRSLSSQLTDTLQSDRLRDKQGAQAAVMGLALLQRAAALFQVGVTTQAAISRQFADLPYPAALGTSIAIGVGAGVNVASILAEPLPSSHIGSTPSPGSRSLAPDERIIRNNEEPTVLTRQALDMVGGANGVGALNAGRRPMGRSVAPTEVYLQVQGATVRLESDDDPVPWRQ